MFSMSSHHTIVSRVELLATPPSSVKILGKLPYSANLLCAPDERKKKFQGARSSSDSTPADQGRSSLQYPSEKSGQSANKGVVATGQKKGEDPNEVSSPVK